MNDLKLDNLISIEQMPKIFSQLEEVGKWVDEGIAKLNLQNLVCTEENKKEIKETRTNIRKISNTLETRRKEIKKQILEPYELFNQKYDELVKNKLDKIDNELGQAIEEIEINQRTEKIVQLRFFFENYVEEYHLKDIIKFEDVGLNITLSASISSLKEQIKEFVEKVNNDINAINSCEDKEELLYEYKNNGFDYSKATIIVNERKKALEQAKQQLDTKQECNVKEQENVKKVEILVEEPVKIEEEKYTVAFEIVATREQILELKEWLKEKGIEYK